METINEKIYLESRFYFISIRNCAEFAAGIKDLILRKEERNTHCIGEFSYKINTQNTPIIFKITIDEITGKKITRDNS